MNRKVIVTTICGSEYFDNIEQARKKYPELDLKRPTKTFTQLIDDGDDTIRFESWAVHDSLLE